MNRPFIILVSGKNPLLPSGGYASYSTNLGLILSSLKYKVKIFCLGKKSKVNSTKIGEIHIIPSKLFTLLPGIEMLGLPFLALKLAQAILPYLKRNKLIIWGVGPWSLAGAILKLFFPKKLILFSDYFTSIKHEFSGSYVAINTNDYGFWLKLQVFLASWIVIPLYNLLEQFSLFRSDKIITHYQSTENILKRQFKIKSAKIVRLPYFIKGLRRLRQKKEKFPLILTISRHDPRKGINFLLHSYKLLNKEGIKFRAIIIGGGKLFFAHKQLAKKFGLRNVKILGQVNNIIHFLKTASIFVLPSLEEGSSSLALLEAAYCALPIITTNIDGIPEDLDNNKSALLIAPKDEKAIADAIEKLFKNPLLAKKLGLAAQKMFQKKYDEKKVRQMTADFLKSFHTLQ